MTDDGEGVKEGTVAKRSLKMSQLTEEQKQCINQKERRIAEFIRTHPNPFQNETGKWLWFDADKANHGPYELREDAERELESYSEYRYKYEGRW
jgi:hypothetical protein